MPYKSRWSVTPPVTSLPSFIFTSPTALLPNDPILLDANCPEAHCFTLHTFREWSKRLAAGLVAAGLKTGERVMLFSGNSIFSPIVVMGVIMAGGVYTSANPAFTPRELAHQLKDSEATFLLAADNCIDRALHGARLAGVDLNRVFQFQDISLDEETNRREKFLSSHQLQHWKQLIAAPDVGKQFEWEEFRTPQLANRTIILIYSSGTTGLPKGVEASHYNIVANITQIIYVQGLDPRNNAGPNTRTLCFLPLYHGLGLMYYTWVAPKRGLRVYLMERFNLLEMVEYIQRYRITELLMVPPVVLAMSQHPLIKGGKYDLSSIVKVVCGAAPLGMETTIQFEKLWPNGAVKVRQAWGMSEYACPATDTFVVHLLTRH